MPNYFKLTNFSNFSNFGLFTHSLTNFCSPEALRASMAFGKLNKITIQNNIFHQKLSQIFREHGFSGKTIRVCRMCLLNVAFQIFTSTSYSAHNFDCSYRKFSGTLRGFEDISMFCLVFFSAENFPNPS